MHLGVDVGGTHTDAVLLGPAGPGRARLLAAAKAQTAERVIEGLTEVLDRLLTGRDPAEIGRLTVSTTLGLNSVLTGTADPVGALVTGGPGLELDPADWGPHFRALPGQQDHRGRVLVPVEPAQARAAAAELAEQKVAALVTASKFGPKNPELEEVMRRAAETVFEGPIMAASRLFGGLNLPRRLAGALLNAAVKRLYEAFIDDLSAVARTFKLSCPIFFLKADGGVMDLQAARERPALALAAGPAASLLGLWASLDEADAEDVLMIDVGGTSTDLAILSRGRPLLVPGGLTLAGRPTLVRGLLTHSLALGGDTDLEPVDGSLRPAPRRRGPALAWRPAEAGQRPPTLTDALNVLGLCRLGEVEASRRAFELLRPGRAAELAREGLDAFLARLAAAVEDFVAQVNSRPVYTVSEFLVDWRLAPRRAHLLGGPAETLAPWAAEALGLPVSAPANAAAANALGAALARPTVEAELYADTAHGTLSVPTLGRRRTIDQRYGLEEAKKELLDCLGGSTAQVTAAECFAQIGDYGRSGRVIRVAAQSAPGLEARLA
ncbi:MAG: hydantoinase/oxoprolinase family protein [Deltaproteobacteria bacterium]|jgi:N-methylhydantoinase A/oxoprolinase/acetone carboxylase beta subunit|nr:hydantoinase/oxoprolinase family protein [Deltaproteobacteria bacterium]